MDLFKRFIIATLLTSIWCDTNFRLNSRVIPSEYEITIKPYFDTGDDLKFTFDGEVTIKINALDPEIAQIKLHSKDLIFGAENVTISDGTNIIPLSLTNPIEFNTNYSFVYINLATALTANKEYEVNILYRGPIRDDLTGVYRSSYKENGTTKWLAATHMEPYSTRNAFPCFDEPEYKARFNLIIDRPENFSPTLANTKLQSTTFLNNGYIRERFYPSPIMSSYLVAFVVSEFQNGGYIQNGDKPFGVWARPEATGQLKYAFEFGRLVEEALSNYTSVDYYSVDNNINLNHVGIPDFRGAMENWGLIDYGERRLLYDESKCSPAFKLSVAKIIAHESAHQWFGNLVTCHWWSDTWLNEGFATYFEDYITMLIDSELGAGDLQVTEAGYLAAQADETSTASALTHDVNSPTEISAHFGTISYKKGGTIIRMIHHLIGDEAFKLGLLEYLNNGRLNLGTPSMLYSALDTGVSFTNSMAAYPGYTVARVMAPWVTQAGHPLLDVAFNHTSSEVTLTQNRFYSRNSNKSDELYPIPITYATESIPNFNETKPAFIMAERTYKFGNFSAEEWIIFNIQETGYYRVNYDDHLWLRIVEALKADHTKIHHLNRAKIINDIFELAGAEYVSYDLVYDVLDYLTEETDCSVWSVVLSHLDQLRLRLKAVTGAEEITKFALNKMKKVIEDLGFDEHEGDSIVRLNFRQNVIDTACKFGHKECIDHAVSAFKQFRNEGIAVRPSLRPRVYCSGLKYGTEEDFDFMKKRMESTNFGCEATVISDALSCTAHKEKLKSFLEGMMSEGATYGNTDILTQLTSVLSHEDNFEMAFTFMKQYYAAIKKIVRNMTTVVAGFVNAAASNKGVSEAEADIENWLSMCTACTSEEIEATRKSVEVMRSDRAWYTTHANSIVEPLRQRNAAKALSASSFVALVCTAVVVNLFACI